MPVKFIKQITNNVFLKNVSTLAVGTLLSQLILLLSSPILTRLFSPSDFGLLALFTSVSTIAAILTTGRYELAIGLTKEDDDSANLTSLVIYLGAISSALYLFLIFLIKHLNFSNNFGDFVKMPISYLIPFFTFFAATYSGFQYWNQRKKNYKRIAFSVTIQILGATIFNLFFGFIGFKSYGLIVSLLIGQFLGIITLFLTFHKNSNYSSIKYSSIKRQAKLYSSFPKYMIISDFSMTISQQMVPVIFSYLFNAAIVGFFSLANRILRIPTIVLTTSIGNVFRNDAIDSIRLNGSCRALYISTLKKLVLLAVPIYSFLIIASPFLFSVFFGNNWVRAGHFAQIISLMMIFDFVALPLNSLFYVLNKQRIYMWIQFFNMICGIISIYLGYFIFKNSYYAIFFYALDDAIFSLITLFITFRMSKQIYNQL